MAIGIYISLITLNVNRLNAPTKDTDWLNRYKKRKKDPYIDYLQETHFRPEDTYRLKLRG